MKMIEAKDICTAYLEGYIYAKITESLITGQIKSSYLDALKKIAVESVKNYIENSAFSNEEKEEMKNNYEYWADITLHGIKQRLRDSHKLCE
ncbi:hypothetical protein [Leyella stercorea]|uniref:hypothetical protein n=1 Tax=Leyella stercorea TaxID=363265 RepID=UPI00242E6652|nr:hypothetical protein [Leyella stercorea]